MRLISNLLVLWLALPFYGHADVNNCYGVNRDRILSQPIELPQSLYYLSGLNPAEIATAPRSDEEFEREAQENKSIVLHYSYTLNFKGFRLDTKYDFEEGNDFAQVGNRISRSINLYDSTGLQVFGEDRKLSVQKNCSTIETSSEEKTYTPKDNLIVVHRSKKSLGSAEATQTYDLDRTAKTKADLLTRIKSVAEFKASPLSNGRLQKVLLEGDVGASPIEVKVTENSPLSHMNNVTNKIETMQGLEFAMPLLGFTVKMYEGESHGGFSEDFQQGKKTAEHELLSKATWLALIPSNQKARMTVTGFTADDFTKDSLHLSIRGHSAPPKLSENLAAYAESKLTLSRSGWRYELTAHPIAEPTYAEQWNASTRPEDQPFLKSTHYIQISEMQTYVDSFKSKVGPMNRYQAAKIIAHVVDLLIQYDQDAVDQDTVDIRTTKDILQSKKGVCQHYANLFAAMARGLGIPTKIISGIHLSASGAVWHAWNEVEIAPNIWWPIEPQLGSPPTLVYLPVSELIAYNWDGNFSSPEVPLLLETQSQNASLNKAIFTKLP